MRCEYACLRTNLQSFAITAILLIFDKYKLELIFRKAFSIEIFIGLADTMAGMLG